MIFISSFIKIILYLIFHCIVIDPSYKDQIKQKHELDPEDMELLIDIDKEYPDKGKKQEPKKNTKDRLSFMRKGLLIDATSTESGRKPQIDNQPFIIIK